MEDGNHWIDPASIKTAALRGAIEQRQVLHHRLRAVMGLFTPFPPEVNSNLEDVQLCSADAAIIFAIASLATHPQREICNSHFSAHIDILYLYSEEARSNVSDAEFDQIKSRAFTLIDDLRRQIAIIHEESVIMAMTSGKTSFVNIAVRQLTSLREHYLEHLGSKALYALMLNCVNYRSAANMREKGIVSSEDLRIATQKLVTFATQLESQVLGLVDSGRLIVRNGKIVNPFRPPPPAE